MFRADIVEVCLRDLHAKATLTAAANEWNQLGRGDAPHQRVPVVAALAPDMALAGR